MSKDKHIDIKDDKGRSTGYYREEHPDGSSDTWKKPDSVIEGLLDPFAPGHGFDDHVAHKDPGGSGWEKPSAPKK